MLRQRCDHPLVPKVGEPKGARSCKVRLEPRPEGEVPDTGQILRDRLDLTLECIRRHYESADNTLPSARWYVPTTRLLNSTSNTRPPRPLQAPTSLTGNPPWTLLRVEGIEWPTGWKNTIHWSQSTVE